METSSVQPAVLLLGTGHLANRNRDMFNTQYDDMLAPKRQGEIRECAERLKRFRPTKVALEVSSERDDALNEEYRRYRAGTFVPTADEIHQFGFRIAAELGHERVYAIDWNEGRGDLGLVYSFAQEHQPEIYEALMARGQRAVAEEEVRIRTARVCELLRRGNEPASLRDDHRAYLTMARVGEGKRYVGIDWVKGWYERNLIIFANLTRIVTAPDDRILTIYGAGHIPLLTQFVRDSGLYSLEAVETYLGA